jgi:hypothetical protein
MDEKWVTVATFYQLPIAEMAKAVLEDAGIECWLSDAHVSRLYFPATFGGIKLQVRPEEEEAARSLLHRPTIVAGPDSTDEND